MECMGRDQRRLKRCVHVRETGSSRPGHVDPDQIGATLSGAGKGMEVITIGVF